MLCTGDLTRSCLTTRVDFRWYKDGALLTPGGRYRTLSEPRSGLQVLEIRAASKEDLGCYECEVRQAAAGEGWGAFVKDPAISPASMVHDERGDTRFRSPRVRDGTPRNCCPSPMMRKGHQAHGPPPPMIKQDSIKGRWVVSGLSSTGHAGARGGLGKVCAGGGHMGSGLHGRSQGSK